MGSGAGSPLGAPTDASSTLNAFAISDIARRAPDPISVNATNTRFHNVRSDTSVVTDDASSRRCNSRTGSLGAQPNRQSVICRDSPLCSETKVTVQSLNINRFQVVHS